jgi:glycosyl hydrolase, family 85
MKMKRLDLLLGLLLMVNSLVAQRSVNIENYVKLFPNPEWSFYNNHLWEYWDTWEPGNFTEDDNFFIARTRMHTRFTNPQTQIDPDMEAKDGCKIFWWMPISDGDKAWMAHPRYTMKADNFSMWQYLDVHGNWNQEFFRADGCFSDVCFRNGVKNGVLMFFEPEAGLNTIDYKKPGNNKHAKILATLMRQDESGKFTEIPKLIKILKYYGISGLTFNPELGLTAETARALQSFLAECRNEAERQGWGHQWYTGWYATMTNTGGVDLYTNALTNTQIDWFQHPTTGDAIVDHWFLNYNNTESKLKASAKKAEEVGRSSYEIYAGQHIGTRGLGEVWEAIYNSKVSIGTWGEHGANNIYGSSKGDTPKEYVLDYQKKLEMFFSGGNQNPANCPDGFATDRMPVENTAMKKFHGMAKMVVAQSTLSELPFVTRFGLGNGESYYVEGKKVNGFAWYNIGMQDYLPTWRWWVSDAMENVPQDAIQCDLTYDEAYTGGSALKLSGATNYSKIRLFKTNFTVQPTDKASVTFKLKKGVEPKFKLIYSLVDSEGTFKSIPVSNAKGAGEWTTIQWDLSSWGISANDQIACLGLEVLNTAEDYEAYIGEMSILRPSQSYQPVKPKLRANGVIQDLNSTGYDYVTFKMIWDSKINEDKWQVVYNDEVDTWYFEVVVQQDGEPVRVVNTTTSWAAMTVAQIDMKKKVKVGVRAVAPDGITRSEIEWSDVELDQFYEYMTDIKVDAPTKLTPGEDITVSLVDPTIPTAHWKVLNDLGETIEEFEGTSFTTALDKIGVYSINVEFDRPTKDDPDAVWTQLHANVISVTPLSTGQTPIASFSVSDTELSLDNGIAGPVSFKFTGRKGEGTSSQAIRVNNMNYIGVSKNVVSNDHELTMAAWVKNNGSQSDMIMNYRQTSGNPSWGCFWLHNCDGGGKITLGWRDGVTGGDGKEITDFLMQKDVWYHIAVTFSNDAKTFKIYVNGSLIKEITNVTLRTSEEAYCFGSGDCNSDFDECQIWNRPITAAEVKQAMYGYEEEAVPEDLVVYCNMESINDKDLPNMGTSTTCRTVSLYTGTGMSDYKKVVPEFVPSTSWLPGSTELKATLTWEFPGAATVDQEDEEAPVVTYNQKGEFNASLTVSNAWGTDTQSQLISVSDPTGVHDNVQNELCITYEDVLKVTVAKEGTYIVNVYNSIGNLVDSRFMDCTANQTIQMPIKTPIGIYLVTVEKDGVVLKSEKIIKNK